MDRTADEPAPDLLTAAEALARRAHAGQRDKAGVDYVDGHLADVARRTAALGGDKSTVAAAWLHDLLEDTALGDTALGEAVLGDTVLGHTALGEDALHRFPRRTVDIVQKMTRRDEVPDSRYYAELAADADARLVKLADIASNTDPARTRLLDGPTRDRLGHKYTAALQALGADDADIARLRSTDAGAVGTTFDVTSSKAHGSAT